MLAFLGCLLRKFWNSRGETELWDSETGLFLKDAGSGFVKARGEGWSDGGTTEWMEGQMGRWEIKPDGGGNAGERRVVDVKLVKS